MKLFLNNLKENLQREEDLPFQLRSSTRISKLVISSKLRVGRVYAIRYKGKEYTIIVISTQKAPTGIYTALNTRNQLLTCLEIKLNSAQDQVLLEGIYKREKKSTYETTQNLVENLEGLLDENQENSPSPRTIKFSKYFSNLKNDINLKTGLALFGKDRFKTYKLKEIDDIYFLSMNINKEAFEDYD